MSLWTPSGEHEVDRTRPGGEPAAPPSAARPGSPPPASATPGSATPGSAAPRGPSGSPDPAATAGPTEDDERYAEELRRQLADTPAEVVVGNHCYGLFELAAVYLSSTPPQLAEARLAIDALGHLVDGLGPRLGDAAGTLGDALAQIRLAYVQVDAAARRPPADGAA
ncbi:MAG TPA: hypothetical protein VGL60_13080 [Acidimicrobiales bacterium]|jgi:hypothetical protein